MAGESNNFDYKAGFDSTRQAKLDLVKDLVAMANSGGGTILFGHNESLVIGIDKSTVILLDSAKVVEWVRNFIAPANIELSHETKDLGKDKYTLSLTVAASEYPILMSVKGVWKSNAKIEKPTFDIGDIFVRHSTRTERATYEDIRQWIVRAKTAERQSILDRVNTFVNLPEGAEVQVVSQAGLPIDTPKRLLQNAIRRRERDPSHLLSAHDLLWLFQLREQSELSTEELRMVIASALRRSPTLFWWLLKAETDISLLNEEVSAALGASDRDKSDAAGSIIEVSAIYLDDSELRMVLKTMRESRYSHFRDEAKFWTRRSDALARIRKRINAARIDKSPALGLQMDALEVKATELASRISRAKSVSSSRSLADITRVIWAKKSRYANF